MGGHVPVWCRRVLRRRNCVQPIDSAITRTKPAALQLSDSRPDPLGELSGMQERHIARFGGSFHDKRRPAVEILHAEIICRSALLLQRGLS